MEAETLPMMDEVVEQKTVSGFGLRLKKAREALRLSQRDAAARLHLNVRVIQLLENEDFENAPPATFMRGYMRSYSRLLNIPDQEVDVAFEQIGLNQPQPTGTSITTPLLSIGEHQHSRWYMQWANYVLVSTLVVLVGVWWSTRAHYSPDKLSQMVIQQLPSAPTVVVSQAQPAAVAPATQASATATNPAAPTTAKPVVNEPQSAASTTTNPAQPAAPTATAQSPVTATAPTAAQATAQSAPTVVIAPTAPLQDKPKSAHRKSRSDNMGMILQEPGLESDGNTDNNSNDY